MTIREQSHIVKGGVEEVRKAEAYFRATAQNVRVIYDPTGATIYYRPLDRAQLWARRDQERQTRRERSPDQLREVTGEVIDHLRRVRESPPNREALREPVQAAPAAPTEDAPADAPALHEAGEFGRILDL